MAVTLANGSIVQIATGLAAEKKITAISNAEEAVATCTAHGLVNGDYVVIVSGWGGLNERVFRVTSVDANSFKLDGVDTRDLNKYPAARAQALAKRLALGNKLRRLWSCRLRAVSNNFTNTASWKKTSTVRFRQLSLPVRCLSKLPTTRTCPAIRLRKRRATAAS